MEMIPGVPVLPVAGHFARFVRPIQHTSQAGEPSGRDYQHNIENSQQQPGLKVADCLSPMFDFLPKVFHCFFAGLLASSLAGWILVIHREVYHTGLAIPKTARQYIII
jgi:hypothetical protein